MELASFMYKHFNEQLPVAFNDYFKKQTLHHDYHTRNSQDYIIPRMKTNFAYKQVRTSGAIIWNSIGKSTKYSKNIKHFRKQVKNNLIEIYE